MQTHFTLVVNINKLNKMGLRHFWVSALCVKQVISCPLSFSYHPVLQNFQISRDLRAGVELYISGHQQEKT